MAENENGQEKTEAPTARRMQKAVEEGQVPKSQEINTVAMLIAGVLAFFFYGNYLIDMHMYDIRYYFDLSKEFRLDLESYYPFVLEIMYRVVLIIAPFFIIFVLTAIIINVAQVGIIFNPKQIKFDPKKINPQKGIERILGNRGRVELFKSIFKIFLIAPVMFSLISSYIPELITLIETHPLDTLIHIAWLALELSIYALLILLILAIIDFTYQRWQNTEDMKMTKDEVKQEMKDVQGDPQIKSRIRSIQMEMARKRMMEEVPEAEVVVTNPTEYAIALKYDQGEQAAPVVVAKGRNHMARRIKAIAVENGVPIVENRPLAQAMYRLVEVGGFIPPELYQAVAEVLAYVYRLQNRVAS